ncbi:unnamed protein product [Angiostrongylus costaricensis]|uniref:Uncharacterized protein n=1 Tax=Angiostrongylus costaricensis TaxID=334426 RepID=A0A0R3PDS2_ANGCS|nr:unnamed protein product [Angiostrongylus costaricensis]
MFWTPSETPFRKWSIAIKNIRQNAILTTSREWNDIPSKSGDSVTRLGSRVYRRTILYKRKTHVQNFSLFNINQR